MNTFVLVVSSLGFLYSLRELYRHKNLYGDSKTLKYVYLLLCLFWLTLFLSAFLQNSLLSLLSLSILISHLALRRTSRRNSLHELKQSAKETEKSSTQRVKYEEKNSKNEAATEADEEAEQTYTEIIRAIAKGNFQLAEEKSKKGFDVNYVSQETEMPLLTLLLGQGHGELLVRLARRVADNPKYSEEERQECRDLVSTHENVDRGCKLLISLGAHIDSTDINDRNNVMLAAKNGYTETLNYLIESGANINYQRNDGACALIEAVQSRAAETVKLLLENGALKDLQDKNGKKAIDYAIDEDIANSLRE